MLRVLEIVFVRFYSVRVMNSLPNLTKCEAIWENTLHVAQGNFAEINKTILKLRMNVFIS